MHSRSRLSSLLSHSAAIILGMAIAWTAAPLWRQALMSWNQSDYGLLVEQCDTAMRDHFQAKKSVQLGEGSSDGGALAASEIGLIVCQDYDIYQKRLLQWGLREDELAQMRLLAIEARASDLQEVVETHEIRF